MQTAAWASPWPWLLGASPPPFAYTQALCLLAALQLAGALYLHALHRHLRPGLPRLLAAAPVLASNLAAPRFFRRRHDVTTMVLVAFNNSWLSTFKVLMWVLNRGALAQNRLTAAQFVSLLLFPLTPVAGVLWLAVVDAFERARYNYITGQPSCRGWTAPQGSPGGGCCTSWPDGSRVSGQDVPAGQHCGGAAARPAAASHPVGFSLLPGAVRVAEFNYGWAWGGDEQVGGDGRESTNSVYFLSLSARQANDGWDILKR